MIRELRLERFGRFEGRSFALGPVTAFLGPNESGKSTLFDALFAAICRPGANIKAGKDLRRRYGDYTPPEVEWDGEAPEIEADEFLNLFAIRSGAFDVKLDDKSDWLRRVKSELFSGGLDPNRLVRELGEEAAESGRSRAARQIRDKTAERERLGRELDTLKRQRDEVLARQQRVEQAVARLRQQDQQAGAAVARLAEVEARLAQQRLIRERERHARVLAEMQRVSKALDEIEASGAAADEAPLAAFHARVEEARSRVAAAEAGERQAREEREKAAAAAAAEERALADARAAAALAAELRRSHERHPGTVLAAAAALAALGLALAGALAQQMPPWARATLGAAAAGALAAAWALRGPGRARIARVQEEWRRRGGPGELAASRWVALLAELHVREGAPARLGERAAAAAAALAAREEALAAAAADAARRREELAAAVAGQERWLREHGAASAEDYHARRARRLAAERLAAEARALVAEARAEYGAADDDALRAEVDRRLRELDTAIVEAPLREPEMRRLEGERATLRDQAAKLVRDREKVKEQVDQERGGIRSSLGELPQRIVAAERDLAACAAELQRMELGRRAAAIARDLFAEIARDSDALMEQLAGEVASLYGDLVGGARGVSLAAFGVDGASVVDAGGAARDFGALSSGTRDLFLLAARLALASRSRPRDALVVLDEPFQTIDGARAERALALLERFRREQGWQVVLFSKEEELAPRIAALFPDALVHRLAPDAA